MRRKAVGVGAEYFKAIETTVAVGTGFPQACPCLSPAKYQVHYRSNLRAASALVHVFPAVSTSTHKIPRLTPPVLIRVDKLPSVRMFSSNCQFAPHGVILGCYEQVHFLGCINTV